MARREERIKQEKENFEVKEAPDHLVPGGKVHRNGISKEDRKCLLSNGNATKQTPVPDQVVTATVHHECETTRQQNGSAFQLKPDIAGGNIENGVIRGNYHDSETKGPILNGITAEVTTLPELCTENGHVTTGNGIGDSHPPVQDNQMATAMLISNGDIQRQSEDTGHLQKEDEVDTSQSAHVEPRDADSVAEMSVQEEQESDQSDNKTAGGEEGGDEEGVVNPAYSNDVATADDWIP